MMDEHFDDAADRGICHEDWHSYVQEQFLNDSWAVDDGLLLLANVWPADAVIEDRKVRTFRHGEIEPPVICKAGLLYMESNFGMYNMAGGCATYENNFGSTAESPYTNHEQMLIEASRNLGRIRRLWETGTHTEPCYSPEYFVGWARSKGIQPCWIGLWDRHLEGMQSEAPSIAHEEPDQGRPKWPWGNHETELLRKLADAALQMWSTYDQDQPTTAPTNYEVIEYLKSRGVAQRTAEVMATILRANGLPTGPRK